MVLNLIVKRRELGKKSILTKLRNDGFIPGIVYSEGKKGINLKVEEREFSKLVKKSAGELAIVNLEVDGQIIKSIIKAKQMHPVSRKYVHVDFLELHAGKEIQLLLPIHFLGTAIGTTTGGLLDTHIRELSIKCLPKDIPEDLKIDISELKLSESIHVSDIEIPNVSILTSLEATIVNVAIPRGSDAEDEETETETEEEETTEETPEKK